MDEDIKLQIVVNDELIDLRNHNFEEDTPFRPFGKTSTKFSTKSLSVEDQRQTVNGLKKLANTLCSSPAIPLLQKHRNIIRERQKARAFSVDPRFRRDRSPMPVHETKASHSRSQSIISETDKERGDYRKGSQSTCSLKTTSSNQLLTCHPGDMPRTFKTERGREIKKDRDKVVNKEIDRGREIIGDMEVSRRRELYKEGNRNRGRSPGKEISRVKESVRDKGLFKHKEIPIKDREIRKKRKQARHIEHNVLINTYDTIAKEYVCKVKNSNNIKSSFVEQGTMTDDCNDLEDFYWEDKVNALSCYETALSQPAYKITANNGSVAAGDVKTVDVATEIWRNNVSPVVDSDMKICKQISPYWDDPRLVEKYADVIKPIPTKLARSLWTLPLSNNKKFLHSTENSSVVFGCSNVLNSYKFDNTTDIDEASISYETAKEKLWEALWKNYNFTPFFLLGSLCGLGLVTLLSWMLASDFLWFYFHPVKREEKWYGPWLAYVCGGIIHGIESVIKAIAYVLFLPRQQTFNREVQLQVQR